MRPTAPDTATLWMGASGYGNLLFIIVRIVDSINKTYNFIFFPLAQCDTLFKND